MFIKVMLEKSFEFNGKFYRGVSFKDGVGFTSVGDCNGNVNQYYQFTVQKSNQVVLLIAQPQNAIRSISFGDEAPENFAMIDPDNYPDLPVEETPVAESASTDTTDTSTAETPVADEVGLDSDASVGDSPEDAAQSAV